MKFSLRTTNLISVLLILTLLSFSIVPSDNTDQLTGYVVNEGGTGSIQETFFWIGIFLFVITTVGNLIFFVASK